METALKCAHFILLYCTQLHCSVLVMVNDFIGWLFSFYTVDRLGLCFTTFCFAMFQIDLAFNDADVIEEETLAAVIGRQTMEGGESLIQEKVTQKCILQSVQFQFLFQRGKPQNIDSNSTMDNCVCSETLK